MSWKHTKKILAQNVQGETRKLKNSRKARRRRHLAIPALLLAILTMGIVMVAIHYYTAETYLVLQGDEQITVGKYGLFEDPGVIAKRGGRDISDRVEVESNLDLSTPGDYEITYHSGNFTVQRSVTVLDRMLPKLKLKGAKNQTILLGETFEEPGYNAKAEDGTSLKDRVQVSCVLQDTGETGAVGGKNVQQLSADGKTLLSRAGTYEITYTVEDDEGHVSQRGRTVTVEPNTSYEAAGLPICMYHYVYDANDPPADVNARYKNYISQQDLIEEMNWLNEEGYYYPTWKEVRDYVDGKLLLPAKSIVLTFDDGEQYTLEHLLPVVEQTHVPVTSFLITVHSGERKVKEFKSEYLHFESHTHDLHRGGGSAAYRGILPAIDYATGVADLKKSVEICGSHDALAYPYGDNNANTHAMMEEVGFLCGVTIQWGKAYPGMDPLVLPRIRMWQDQTMNYFTTNVSPPATAQ